MRYPCPIKGCPGHTAYLAVMCPACWLLAPANVRDSVLVTFDEAPRLYGASYSYRAMCRAARSVVSDLAKAGKDAANGNA